MASCVQSLALVLAAVHVARGVVSPKPNVVFILADDLGYANVGYNAPAGLVHTPTIDKLAVEGVRLDGTALGSLQYTLSRTLASILLATSINR